MQGVGEGFGLEPSLFVLVLCRKKELAVKMRKMQAQLMDGRLRQAGGSTVGT